MRIAKIKNRYMFNSSKPNGTHDYLVYKDRNTSEVRVIELTHLYKPDRYNFSLINRGILKKMRFGHRDTPSGVNNGYFSKNINGKSIDLNHKDVNLNVYRKVRISNKQSNDVIRFAKRKYR